MPGPTPIPDSTRRRKDTSPLALPFASPRALRIAWILPLVPFILIPHAAAFGPSDSQPTPALPPSGVRLLESGVSTRQAEQALERATGGAWTLRWDPELRVAAMGRGGAAPKARSVGAQTVLASAHSFRAAHAELLGAATATLERVRFDHAGKAWYVTWEQRHAGKRVLGAHLDLTLAEDGTVVAFRSSLVPEIDAQPAQLDPEAALRAVSAALGRPVRLDRAEPVLAVRRQAETTQVTEAMEVEVSLPAGARWRALVAASDARLLELDALVRESMLTGTVRTTVVPKYAEDIPMEVVLPWLEVQAGFAQTDEHTHSDAVGEFGFDLEAGEVLLRSSLRGLYLWVDNQTASPSPHFERLVTVPRDIEVRFGALEARTDERTIYHHANRMHDMLKTRYGFDLLDFRIPAIAAATDPFTGDPNYPNAYWDGYQLGFGLGGAIWWNLGMFSDVIYHEYTHAVTDYIYRPAGPLVGPIGAAMHEGLADYFAATLNGDPDLGEFLQRHTDAPVRSLANRQIWPDHRADYDEPHGNGIIFGGALWDLRVLVGPEVADALVHYARMLFPRSFDEFCHAMLVQDELLFGDGWLANGSPHDEQVTSAFAMHGMGPLVDRSLHITHVPLRDTEDTTSPRKVRADFHSFLRDQDGYMRLSYRTNGDFTHAYLVRGADGSYHGAIPPMPEGTQVAYYIAAGRYGPPIIGRLPAGAPQEVFTYRVGVDAEAPALEHSPLLAVPAFGWPPELAVHIEDNLGLAYAFAEIWRGGERVGTVGFVPAADEPNLYVARFPNVGAAVGEEFDYAITAIDASRAGNTARLPASGALRLQVVQDLAESFDVGSGGWRHRAIVLARPDPWQLAGTFNHGTGSGRAWWCGGEGGEYPVQTAAELASDWFRVDGAAIASVWSWIDAETDGEGRARDGGRVEIRAEGDLGWSVLAPVEGYTHMLTETAENALGPDSACLSGRDTSWRQLHFDLEPWSGQRVRFRFVFASDAVATTLGLRGWLVDDFHFEPGTSAPTDAATLPSHLQLRVGPNPFNPRLSFDLQVPARAGHLQLVVMDARGRVLRRVLDATLAPGPHRLGWDGADEAGVAAASGVYYYRLSWAQGLESGKVVLLR